jgi:exopolysaccharide biosynthesis predicted pyruvyltransferase EpsI
MMIDRMTLNMPIPSTDIIQGLQKRLLETIPPLADPGRGYALLDFPNYPNVGDSLIWLGAVRFLNALSGCNPAYICTRDGFDPAELRRFLPQGPIYLSGGGNFGDIWPKFQVFRQRVLEAFPDRRVVQLPQSIHFTSEANITATRRMIEQHGNFVLLVRDRESLDLARENFRCESHLCPDMAFALGSQPVPPGGADAVFLLRTDIERGEGRGGVDPALRNVVVADWLDDGRDTRLLSRVALPAARRAVRYLPAQQPLFSVFTALARSRMARGKALLGRGRCVVTDRLHAHILSVLIDRPQWVIDNANGKVGRFVRDWTADAHGVEMVPSVDAACLRLGAPGTGAAAVAA